MAGKREVICVVAFSVGFSNPVKVGEILSRDDPRVIANPQFFREVGEPLEAA